MINTEVYIKTKSGDFAILDLNKNESINMRFSKKDLQDITKVFAPYSMNFTFPATPRNRLALGFFGNTEVVKYNSTNEFDCKIYVNGFLSQKGKLKLNSVKYSNNKSVEFSGSFTTTFLSLKDRLGNDEISGLSSIEVPFVWRADNVFQKLKNITSVAIDGITFKYFVPLISNNRVLNYSDDLSLVTPDNIRYNASSSPLSDRVINTTELRPALSVLTLLELIKKKYGLVINTPLEATKDITELYLWCNNEFFLNDKSRKFNLLKQFTGNTSLGTAVVDFSDSSIKITTLFPVTKANYFLTLFDTKLLDPSKDAKITLDIVNKATGNIALSREFTIVEGTNNLIIFIPASFFEATNDFEFFTFMRFSQPTTWSSSAGRVRMISGITATNQSFAYNYNSTLVGASEIDLMKALPKMKVIDFLTSYLKTFNLSIYDSSPNDDNLFFLTPKDIDTTGLVYSKKESDYTTFIQDLEVEKSVNNQYNYYNFKHIDSKYRSNIDFEKQFKIKYGQTFFPAIKPEKTNEFIVETKFSIIPPVLIIGLENTFTAYGFTNDKPEVTNDRLLRYKPNYNEPTLFYSHGSELLEKPLGCQNLSISELLITSSLDRYVKVMPFCKETENSLGFSVLKIENETYLKSLYLNYYSSFIGRLLNPNALSQTYTLNLPSTELYLNEATTSQGAGATPSGFRLQNDIILQETRFEILDATIDITTGRAKLTLLNY